MEVVYLGSTAVNTSRRVVVWAELGHPLLPQKRNYNLRKLQKVNISIQKEFLLISKLS